jgi:SAM-dependent methyltransferase
MIETDNRLTATQRAFDSVAENYDGPRGNNALIQRMREDMWVEMAQRFAPGQRLLDLGCGTGIDALHFAQLGYNVVASDWSPEMVARAASRAVQHNLQNKLVAKHIGIQELEKFDASDDQTFDGIYSNFGPLNCAPDLAHVSRQCARLLRPGGRMVFTVIGRICPWEVAHYLVKRRLKRAAVRFVKGMTAVNLNKHTVWTRYYTPREFYAAFAAEFELTHYRAFSLFVPPPYLTWVERAPTALRGLAWLDDHLGRWPLLRDAGDHFLIVLTKRGAKQP